MKYSGKLLKLNGKTFDCIISYKLGRNKLWSSDTGRNMAGSMKGSLVGKILDSATIEVEYYNNKYQCTCTADYYANDYEEDLLRMEDMKYKSFPVNLIPNEREDKHVKNK